MIFVVALQLLSALDCDFQTAFKKGAEDIVSGAFGADPDRFCNYATADQKSDFLKAYELGREYGPTLKKGEITQTPKDRAELDSLIKDAKLSMTTKEIVERISKAPRTAPPTENSDIKNLMKRIDALEEENKRLSEKLNSTNSR